MTCHATAVTTNGGKSDSGQLEKLVILVGNPNVGKSVLFGRLTGRYVTVSNYPGTTVEISQGRLPDGTTLIDTPGTNTIVGNSDDERITGNVLIEKRSQIKAVVQVADGKNLRRALLLTLQLIDLGVPLVLNLNMIDEAETLGLQIDTEKLSERLGIEIVPTIAVQGKGLDHLQSAINRAKPARSPASYSRPIENVLPQIGALPPENQTNPEIALHLLNGNPASIQNEAGSQQPPRSTVTLNQLQQVRALLDGVMSESKTKRENLAQRLSGYTVHPVWGWPILLLVLFIVYKFVGELGAGTLVKFMESTLFGQFLNPLATSLIDTALPLPFIHDLLVGPYGLITMALTYGLAIVLPIVFTFFVAFSILEDSGYLPRLAVMLNRAFKVMGLNGKAVLPMVLGLGCDTMATMTTRILETRKERIMVTLLLALGVPCSAQLGVILGMLGIVNATGVLIWAGILTFVMLAVGFLAAQLLSGERSDFILELPPLRRPRIDNILIKTLARIEWYLKEVIPLFIIGTLILFGLDKTGLLVVLQNAAAPLIVNFLGLPPEAAGAFLIGFLRRDYGAAGLFTLALAGKLDHVQIVVSLVVITLFVPCIANVLMIVKEYGGKVALAVAGVVFPLAFLVGGILNLVIRALQITL